MGDNMTRPDIRTRIAPSPTGPCHLGTARTALFNYLFAKGHARHGRGTGTFVFRLEDTDRERSTADFEQELYDSLHWLGLHWDEGPDVGGPYGPYRQSERADRHRAAIDTLVETGHAYRCFCTAEALDAERKRQIANKELVHYSGTCRGLSPDEIKANVDAGKPFTVRFRMPDETFTFADIIRGEVTVKGSTIGDFVIAKPDGSPIFHLSNVVDDAEMEITHVIRGEDHLPNVPRHIALFRALGHEVPVYAHLPLILNPDGSKMGKRKIIEGLEPYVRIFGERGYLPEAMVDFLALLGWSPGGDQEVALTLGQLTDVFSLEKVSKAGARFDIRKLDDLNGQYIRRLPDEAFERQLKAQLPNADPDYLRKTIPLVRERLSRFEEAPEYMRFFFDAEDYDVNLLKAKGHALEGSHTMIAEVLAWLEPLPEEQFTAQVLEEKTRATAEREPYNWKARSLFMVLRAAVTGRTATPPLFETMEVLGKETCVRRLRKALEKLEKADDTPE